MIRALLAVLVLVLPLAAVAWRVPIAGGGGAGPRAAVAADVSGDGGTGGARRATAVRAASPEEEGEPERSAGDRSRAPAHHARDGGPRAPEAAAEPAAEDEADGARASAGEPVASADGGARRKPPEAAAEPAAGGEADGASAFAGEPVASADGGTRVFAEDSPPEALPPPDAGDVLAELLRAPEGVRAGELLDRFLGGLEAPAGDAGLPALLASAHAAGRFHAGAEPFAAGGIELLERIAALHAEGELELGPAVRAARAVVSGLRRANRASRAAADEILARLETKALPELAGAVTLRGDHGLPAAAEIAELVRLRARRDHEEAAALAGRLRAGVPLACERRELVLQALDQLLAAEAERSRGSIGGAASDVLPRAAGLLRRGS